MISRICHKFNVAPKREENSSEAVLSRSIENRELLAIWPDTLNVRRERVGYRGSFVFDFTVRRSPKMDYWWREAFNHRTVNNIRSDVYVDLYNEIHHL